MGGDHHHLGNDSQLRWAAVEIGGSKSPPLFVSAWSRPMVFGPTLPSWSGPFYDLSEVRGKRSVLQMSSKGARLARACNASVANEASIVSL
jgi:hypothetical protein